MRYDYYERLWEYERRRIEGARLDIAMAESVARNTSSQPLNVVLGHAIIRAGAWLAGEPAPLTRSVAR